MPPVTQKSTGQFPRFGHFSAWPADIIDRAYLNEPSGWFGRLWTGFKMRLIYTAVFLPLVALDLAGSAMAGLAYGVSAFVTPDSWQQYNISQFKKFATAFGRSLSALLAFPLGLFSPKLVAFHFIPKNEQPGMASGGGYYRDNKAVVETPEDAETLGKIVRYAAANNLKVMPVGAGRSQGKQFLPTGGEGAVVVDLAKMNTVSVNPDNKTVTVGAGARWSDIQAAINPHKLALKVMQASNVFSVGGSIGTNIHGWDHRSGTLSNTLLEITIINAKGGEQTLTPKDALFHKVTGGLGLFGIVTRAKIQLTDNERLKETGTAVPLSDYVQHFYTHVQPNPEIRMHLYRLSLDPKHLLLSNAEKPTGIAVDYIKTAGSKPTVTPDFTPEEPRGSRLNQVAVNLARRFGWFRKLYWKSESTRLTANNTPPETTNAIMQPPINALFNPAVSEAEWLQEYFLPGNTLEPFLKKLSRLLQDNNVALLNASVRFVRQNSSSAFSYAKDGDRFAVVLCFNQSYQKNAVIAAQKWLREAQQLALDHGGTFYAPYQQVSSPAQVRAGYTDLQDIHAAKLKQDPKEVFSSGFYQKYVKPAANKPNYFREIMGRDDYKKEFKGFLKNVLRRVEADALYALLEDVLSYKDSHAEIYAELCDRLSEIKPSALADFRQILNSLSGIKADLGSQAEELLKSNGVTAINGLVEIGYPGRFISDFKKHFKVTGKIAAVYEQPSLTDYIQTGFPRPYDEFQPLNYSLPRLSGLQDNSADVITCYVGLHHFPDDQLDIFLTEVRRVLRAGGQFLLVDHDVTDKKSLAMANMAHTVFNAVNGAPLAEEMTEIRNFQPMSHWRACLAKHGLGYAVQDPDVPMIRAGDPSRNRMVTFRNSKPALEHSSSGNILGMLPEVREGRKKAAPVVCQGSKQNDALYAPGRNSVLAGYRDSAVVTGQICGLAAGRVQLN